LVDLAVPTHDDAKCVAEDGTFEAADCCELRVSCCDAPGGVVLCAGVHPMILSCGTCRCFASKHAGHDSHGTRWSCASWDTAALSRQSLVVGRFRMIDRSRERHVLGRSVFESNHLRPCINRVTTRCPGLLGREAARHHRAAAPSSLSADASFRAVISSLGFLGHDLIFLSTSYSCPRNPQQANLGHSRRRPQKGAPLLSEPVCLS
jgi:hypothetical protein